MVDVNHHLQMLETLRRDRSNWDSQWEEVAARIIPAHRHTFHARGNSITEGEKKTELMYDSTASVALQRFAAVMESLATPQGSQWHRVVPSDPALKKNRQVRLFTDEVTRLLFKYRYRPQANFVGQVQKMYNSYGAYGNGLLFADIPDDAPGIRYRSLHLGECYILENHQGVVDTAYRTFRMKVPQILKMFGASAPESVKRDHGDANKAATEYEILHCIYPRDFFDPRRVDGLGMPYASVYIFAQEQKVMREGGYNTFPVALARYVQYVNEMYGRGPAQTVLPAIKVLNTEKRTVLKQGHRIVDPVLLAYDDGAVGTFSLKAGAINPGGVNAQGRPLVHALPAGNIAIGQELMQDERAVINDAFLITLFQILVETNDRMTATEVLERTREKGMLIAPTTGRLQAEFLGPLIEREVDILQQQGLLPEVPAVMAEAGGGYTVEYDAPMSRMARAENAAGFMRSLDTALNFVQVTQDPAPLDWFDFDVAMPAVLDINGSPVAWTRSPEDVKKLREARAQAMQEQQQVEAAPAMASLAKTAAEVERNAAA